MRTGRPIAELVVTAEERATLEGWGRRRSSAQALALRAGIVLDCASGMSNTLVARRRHVSQQMVGKWRSPFVRHRVAGLLDEPRCGAPRTIEDAQIEGVIVRTLESRRHRDCRFDHVGGLYHRIDVYPVCRAGDEGDAITRLIIKSPIASGGRSLPYRPSLIFTAGC
jgi:transposase